MDSSSDLVPFTAFNYFVGFDWAGTKHDVCVVGRDGTILLQMEFADAAEGWAQLRQKLAGLGPRSPWPLRPAAVRRSSACRRWD